MPGAPHVRPHRRTALLAFVIVAVASVRTVQPQQAYVVELLGRHRRTLLPPGDLLLIPFIESVHAKVNMHEQVAKAITDVGRGPHQSRAKPYLSSLPTTQLNAASVTI